MSFLSVSFLRETSRDSIVLSLSADEISSCFISSFLMLSPVAIKPEFSRKLDCTCSVVAEIEGMPGIVLASTQMGRKISINNAISRFIYYFVKSTM